MAKKSNEKTSKVETTRVVSFRIVVELYDILEKQGSELRDETGLPLNASGMARRLVLNALKTRPKGSK